MQKVVVDGQVFHEESGDEALQRVERLWKEQHDRPLAAVYAAEYRKVAGLPEAEQAPQTAKPAPGGRVRPAKPNLLA